MEGVFWRNTFHNIQNHERIEFKLKVSLEKTLFHVAKKSNMKRHLPQFEKFECLMILKLKMSLEETPSTIPKNFNLYKRCHLKRHFLQFHKFQYILKVSLEKTLSTIPQNLICIKNCGNDFKAKDVSLQHKFKIFHYVWKLWKVSLEEALSV